MSPKKADRVFNVGPEGQTSVQPDSEEVTLELPGRLDELLDKKEKEVKGLEGAHDHGGQRFHHSQA